MKIYGNFWVMPTVAGFLRQAAAWSTRASLRLNSRTLTTLKAAAATDEDVKMTNGRISRDDLSLDVKTIVANTELVLSHLKSRRASDEAIEAAKTIASLQSKRVSLIQERDDFLNQRKEASAMVGKLMRDKDNSDPKEVEEQKARSAEAAEGAQKAEAELEEIQSTMDSMLAGIPNLLDDQVPDGDDETQNEEVSKWGDVSALPSKLGWDDEFEPKWHDDVALGLNSYQAEAAVQMSGARFVALSGPVAQLERALAMFFIDLHTSKHGYTEVSVPYIVGRSALEGTSQPTQV